MDGFSIEMDPWWIPEMSYKIPTPWYPNEIQNPMVEQTPGTGSPIPTPEAFSTEPMGTPTPLHPAQFTDHEESKPQAGNVSMALLAEYAKTYHQIGAPEETQHQWSSLKDLIDTLEEYPLSEQNTAISAMSITVAILSPYLLDTFLERLKTSPVATQTNTLADESLRFLGYNDRKDLLDGQHVLRQTHQGTTSQAPTRNPNLPEHPITTT